MRREIFQSLLQRLRPVLTESSEKAWARPMVRPRRMPRRKASEPYLLTSSRGLMTLPLDFDIFLPWASRTRPWRQTSRKGTSSVT